VDITKKQRHGFLGFTFKIFKRQAAAEAEAQARARAVKAKKNYWAKRSEALFDLCVAR